MKLKEKRLQKIYHPCSFSKKRKKLIKYKKKKLKKKKDDEFKKKRKSKKETMQITKQQSINNAVVQFNVRNGSLKRGVIKFKICNTFAKHLIII